MTRDELITLIEQRQPLSAERLVDSDGLLLQSIKRVQAQRQILDSRAAASLWFGHYNWFITTLLLEPFLSTGQTPSVDPSNLSFVLADDGVIESVALISAETTPTASDGVRQQLTDHFACIIPQLKRASRLSEAVQWGLLGDRCVGVLIRLLQRARREEEISTTVAALCAEPFGSYTNPPAAIRWQADSRRQWFLQRSVCCLSYKTPGEINCVTCPLLHPTESQARLDQLMAANLTLTFEPSSRNGEASVPLF